MVADAVRGFGNSTGAYPQSPSPWGMMLSFGARVLALVPRLSFAMTDVVCEECSVPWVRRRRVHFLQG